MSVDVHQIPYPRFSGGATLRPDQYPHGLLRVPQEVLDIVEKEAAKSSPEIFNTEARRRVTDDLTLQYYFEGMEIAYRRTPQGIEVLAVELEEIGEFIRNIPGRERRDVVFAPI